MSEEVTCKGRIFRSDFQVYIGSRGEVVEKFCMIPQKRKSCSGCVKCAWFDEALELSIKEGYAPCFLKDRPINSYQLYKLSYVGDGADLELMWVEIEEGEERGL